MIESYSGQCANQICDDLVMIGFILTNQPEWVIFVINDRSFGQKKPE
jgi:hypothetical protein